MSRRALGDAALEGLDGGDDPLGTLLPPRRPRDEPAATPAQETPPISETAPDRPAEPTAERGRLTVDLDAGILEAAKRAVWWTPGLTLVRLVEEALSRDVERREAERAEPFAEREGELVTGRPLG